MSIRDGNRLSVVVKCLKLKIEIRRFVQNGVVLFSSNERYTNVESCFRFQIIQLNLDTSEGEFLNTFPPIAAKYILSEFQCQWEQREIDQIRNLINNTVLPIHSQCTVSTNLGPQSAQNFVLIFSHFCFVAEQFILSDFIASRRSTVECEIDRAEYWFAHFVNRSSCRVTANGQRHHQRLPHRHNAFVQVSGS